MLDQLLQGFNWFDVLLAVFIFYFLYASEDFISSLLDLIGFMVTVVLSYKFYIPVSSVLASYFSIPRGISQAVGFFIIWFLIESVIFIFIRVFLSKIPHAVQNNPINRVSAFIPAFIQACLFYLLIVITIFSLPVRPSVKEALVNSKTGPVFISFSHVLESKIKAVFGEAVNETINFMTIKEGVGEGVELGFKAPPGFLTVDSQSEETMLHLVNEERLKNGDQPLAISHDLQLIAREYGRQMLMYGFFSHESQVDGSTPAERVDKAGISYQVTGENLAYAPDVYIAHQGLMNSPGHRKNILSSEYGKVGIGVIDAGIYGRIFVQEFTN